MTPPLPRQSSGGLEPFYDDGAVTIYHGDCRDVLPQITADILVTDPPYGIAFKSGWTGSSIVGDETTEARDHVLAYWLPRPAVVFGAAGEARLSPRVPLVWWRPGSGMGDLAFPWKPDYELIHVFGEGFEGHRGTSILRYPWGESREEHPHKKPVPLMRDIIAKCPPGVLVDPFMGSGSTLRAAKDLGRRAIGIEIEERYCALAARRCAQDVLDLGEAA